MMWCDNRYIDEINKEKKNPIITSHNKLLKLNQNQ